VPLNTPFLLRLSPEDSLPGSRRKSLEGAFLLSLCATRGLTSPEVSPGGLHFDDAENGEESQGQWRFEGLRKGKI
jgi:hypothetical protein